MRAVINGLLVFSLRPLRIGLFTWYGFWYGNHENHHYTAGRSGRRNSHTCLSRTGCKRFCLRETCRRSCPFRCSWLEPDAKRRTSANRRPANEKGTCVGGRASLCRITEETLQKREGCVSGITFDAGGLIALDRNDRRVLTLVARATERGMRITIGCAT
jgi:hypothetical protein